MSEKRTQRILFPLHKVHFRNLTEIFQGFYTAEKWYKRFDTIANDKFHNKCFDKNWKPSTSCTNFRTKINAPCFLFHVRNYNSLLYLVHAITRTNASTRATSLMSVKNSTHHFCLKHLVPGTLKLKKWKNKNVKLKLSFFFNFC